MIYKCGLYYDRICKSFWIDLQMRSYPTTAFVKQFYPKNLKRATSFTFTFTFLFFALRFNVLRSVQFLHSTFCKFHHSFVFVFASFIIHFVAIVIFVSLLRLWHLGYCSIGVRGCFPAPPPPQLPPPPSPLSSTPITIKLLHDGKVGFVFNIYLIFWIYI